METNEMSSEVEEKQVATDQATNTEEEKTSPAEVESETFGPKAIAAISKQRSEKQGALVAQARAEGKLEALMSQRMETATISPIETAKDAYIKENGDLEGFTLSVELYEQQEAYRAHQATKAAQGDAATALANQQAVSLNASKIVHDDWQDVINVGEKLLSKGEHLDVTSAGADFGEVAYAKCKAAIERNKSAKETSAAPKKELSEQEAKEKKEADEKAKAKVAPSQNEVLKGASAAAKTAFKL